MSTDKNKKSNLSALRKKAEEKLIYSGSDNAVPLEIEHELNVHKVELEMQNEELRSTQLKLEKSLDNYAELFALAPIGYFILDKNGTIINVNNIGCNLLGLQKAAIIENPFSIFLSSELYQDDFYRHRNEVIETEKLQQVEGKMNKKGGMVFPVLITSSIVKDEYNKFKYFLSTVSDISERKEQEQKVKLALEKEIELNELKSRFITTASHEFRTPLSTILLSAELLEKYNRPEDEEIRKRHFLKIKSSVHGLTEILLDFLSLDKFENGLVKNYPEKLNLVGFTENIIEELNIKNQLIIYKHSEESQHVYLDSRLLKVCLTNLLGNAIKYSPKDGVIEITTTIQNGKPIKITVKDNGIGIPEEDQPFIFDQFFRAKNAEALQGTGLGLNIVQKFVSVMNGSISFTSKENKGSTFVMVLPNA